VFVQRGIQIFHDREGAFVFARNELLSGNGLTTEQIFNNVRL
jgi:hypothetical protein